MDFLTISECSSVDLRRSYHSGLSAIRNPAYDLCILDMSLPTYDVTPEDAGYETLSYAGDLLLGEMKRRKTEIPTIVLTQFTTFPEKLEEKPLIQLAAELEEKYKNNYLGCVFYADEETSWQSDMETIIKEIRHA